MRTNKKGLFSGLASILMFITIFIVGCSQDQTVIPQVSYTELLAMMNQSVESQIVDAVSMNTWWGGRRWAYMDLWYAAGGSSFYG